MRLVYTSVIYVCNSVLRFSGQFQMACLVEKGQCLLGV